MTLEEAEHVAGQIDRARTSERARIVREIRAYADALAITYQNASVRAAVTGIIHDVADRVNTS